MPTNSRFRTTASPSGATPPYQDQLRYRRRRGPVGAIRRLFGFVFSIVFIAIAVGIFLAILSTAQPDWFDHVMSWFDQI